MKVGLIETCKEIVALEDNFILDMGVPSGWDYEEATGDLADGELLEWSKP